MSSVVCLRLTGTFEDEDQRISRATRADHPEVPEGYESTSYTWAISLAQVERPFLSETEHVRNSQGFIPGAGGEPELN